MGNAGRIRSAVCRQSPLRRSHLGMPSARTRAGLVVVPSAIGIGPVADAIRQGRGAGDVCACETAAPGIGQADRQLLEGARRVRCAHLDGRRAWRAKVFADGTILRFMRDCGAAIRMEVRTTRNRMRRLGAKHFDGVLCRRPASAPSTQAAHWLRQDQ